MTPDPELLLLVAERVRQQRNDRLSVSDERLSCLRLERAVAEQRQQCRNEEAVRGSQRTSALDRLPDDADVAIVEQRHDQRPEARVCDVAERLCGLSACAGVGLARIVDGPQECHLGRVDVLGSAAVRQRDRCSDGHARLDVIEVAAEEHCGVLVRELRQRMQRRGSHLNVFVLDHPLDGRDPSLCDRRTYCGHDAKRPRPYSRRFALKKKWRDQVALVERFEQVDRVDHGAFVRARQFLDQRLDRCRVCDVGADAGRRDPLRHDARAEGADVLAPRDERHRNPPGHHDQACVAQLTPVQAQGARMNEDQDDGGRCRLAEPIHRDVDEWFCAEAQIRRQRNEEHLASRLVERVR